MKKRLDKRMGYDKVKAKGKKYEIAYWDKDRIIDDCI